jgi:tyrocidine synthetase-3
MFDKSLSGDTAIAASQSTKEREYWLEQLSDEPVKSCFPYDNNKELVNKTGDKDLVEVRVGGELFSRLVWISNRSDPRLLTVLAGALLLLINKYTGSRDIIVGMPIYKQTVEGNFINTVVVLRSSLQEEMTFKEWLYRVKQTIDEAIKHQNYPIKSLLYDLKLTFSQSDFPLFDILLMLKNIQDPTYVRHIPANMEFIFFRAPEYLEVAVRYNPFLYDKETIERILSHFSHLLQMAIFNVDLSLAAIDILPEDEKKKLLEEFNQTREESKDHIGKTLHRLFEEQVEKTPGNTALVFVHQGQKPELLTYRELDEKARQLASMLKEKGITTQHIVALLIESSHHMAVAVLAILKAGGAYLPIDIEAPEERKVFILKDSGTRLLLTGDATNTSLFPGAGDIEQLDVTAADVYTQPQPGKTRRTGSELQSKPSDPAYIIYTSGSTGRPKGVIVEHCQAVNTLVSRKKEYRMTARHTALQLFSYAFDGFITSFFTPIISGVRVILLCKDTIQDISKIIETITTYKVTHFISVPVLFQALLTGMTPAEAASLQVVTLAGDKVQSRLPEMAAAKNKNLEIVNEYGVTEAAVMSTIYRHQERDRRVKIGHPIANTSIYITKNSDPQHLLPIGVFGEMRIAGAGVTRGYMNKPELTAEKFDRDLWDYQDYHDKKNKNKKPDKKNYMSHMSHMSHRSHRSYIYKTGDLARWLSDGNIEFSGRMDFQVKVRGFRIELGEIEKHLLAHQNIKEAIITAQQNDDGDKYLCAYITCTRQLSTAELREYLVGRLPEYMIPAYFVILEKMPLSLNGKVDRKQLPPPAAAATAGEYTPPRNRLEKQLMEIWADILGIEKDSIGIDANFFELGGHSLKATILGNRIIKEFNVRISMVDIFKSPDIRSIAGIIKEAIEDIFVSINPAEGKEYYPLSPGQRRLFILYQMDFNSLAYNVPITSVLGGNPDTVKLERAFKQLIARHESLRTSFSTIGEQPVQIVHRDVDPDFRIEYYTVDYPDNSKIAAVVNNFVRPFDLSKTPLLRVGLVKLPHAPSANRSRPSKEGEADKYLLLVDMHHIITDGVSHKILIENFMNLYQDRQLPTLRLQYKDYSQWQQRGIIKEVLQQQEQFWLQQLAGEIPKLDLPIDFPRPAVQSFAGNMLEFQIERENADALRELAESQKATLFMVLLAIYNIFLAKISNQEDIIIGTPVAGRRHADLEQIIGIFINMLALRNTPAGGCAFTIFLKSLTQKTVETFDNQDYAFEDLVEKVVKDRDLARNPVFDVMFVMQNMFDPSGTIGEHEISDLTIKPYDNQARKAAQFDLTLYAFEFEDNLSLAFEYCTSLFKEETIARFIQYFNRVIASVIENPDKNISAVEIITEKEKARVLTKFNATEAEYPINETVPRLFARQAEQTPDHTALVGAEGTRGLAPLPTPIFITYRELNEKSNQLAYQLQAKGVKPDTIVGIMVERSIEMLIGIMGILKSGGAYLPIDPTYPRGRIDFMLKDSKAQVLVMADTSSPSWLSFAPTALLNLSEGHHLNFPASRLLGFPASLPSSLAYIIYTSGTTGKPKGVMIEQTSVVNLLFALQHSYPFGQSDAYLLKTSYVFDVSVTELFGWYMGGGRLVILERGGEKDPLTILAALERNNVTHVNFVPSMFNLFVDYINEENRDRLSGLKYIFLAGEVLLPTWVKKFKNLATTILLENIYGPTESTVYASQYSLAEWEGIGSIPIGKPLQNLRLYILDKDDCIQPINTAGELCISGIGLARGYLNQPGLTSDKFCPLRPGALFEKTAPGPRKNFPLYTSHKSYRSYISSRSYFYHTGDLARWQPDGNIEFLGRIDQQVKIRGFRIEPGEIESRLANHPQIKEAVVTAGEETSGDKYLCAYIVSITETDASELREYLAEQLPGYMIPSYFIPLEKIPLSANGKLDYKALPGPKLAAGREYAAPRDKLEEKLAAIWSDILRIDQSSISINDNFFMLGGHSLKASLMITRIHKELQFKFPLSEVFKTPTIEKLAAALKGLAKDKFIVVGPAEEKEYYALSSAQRRLYFLQQIDTGGITYNLPNIWLLEEETCEKRLADASKKLTARHESLRTSFEIIAGGAVQRIYDEAELEIEHYEIENITRLEKIIQDFIRPFDLGRIPLLRISLVKVNGTGKNHKQRILLFDMHHIISDGISQGILVQEFMQLYAGKELPPLRLQYRDYSEWQHRLTKQEAFKPQENFWLRQFTGEIPLVNLPYDYPRPALQSFEGSVFMFTLEEEETKALNEIARTRGATLFMILLAAYNVFLLKLSRQEDIVVGSPVAGRRHTDLEQIIGMFVNMLALRNNLPGEKTFANFLEEVRENTLLAFDNQDYPFEDLVEKVDIARDLSRNPLFDIGFILQNMYDDPTGILTPLKSLDYKSSVSRFDLSLIVTETAGKLDLAFEYCTRLFKEDTIIRFTGYLIKIIRSIIENPEVKIPGIDILTEEEKNRILYEVNQTTAEYPREKTIHELFRQQTAKMSDKIALTDMGHFALTYRELNGQSGRLARLLIEKGVSPDTIVGIMTEPSPAMIVGILGILKAGAAYLPIEPGYPEERIRYMLKDAKVRILVKKSNIFSDFLAGESIDTISVDDDAAPPSTLRPFYPSGPSNLAYIIYTSGTTGKPKGALIEHRNVIRLFFNDKFQFDFNEKDTWTLFHSFCFDFSVWEMYGALLNGGELVVIPRSAARDIELYLDLLKAVQVTVLNQTPSAFYNLMDTELKNPRRQLYLRWIIFGGEALKPKRLKKWRAKYPETRLVNMYGITETTVHVTFKEIKESEIASEASNIGKPIPTLSTYVMDKNLKLLPVGTGGELLVGGEGVGRGYLNRPELTGEKFVTNPYKPGERLYKSGDLVSLSPAGDLHYLGRSDSQVKIRGFRVELGEIENQLSQHEEIKEAVVAARENEFGDKYLCAYVVSAHQLNIAQLKEYLMGKLPDYMIPSHFARIDRVPLTPNGKIDMKALDKSALELAPGAAYREPQNEMEKTIAQVWKQVLNLDKVGIYDNFFDVGGNSLNIIKIKNALKEILGKDIPIVNMFTYTTIESFSRYLQEEEGVDIYSDAKIEAAVDMMEDTMQLLRGDDNE